MDPADRLKKLYERLPAQSAFRKAIEQALDLAEGLTGLQLRSAEEPPGTASAAEEAEADEPEPASLEGRAFES